MPMATTIRRNSMTMITTIKMQIELKKIAEPQQLEYIRELYISAFPAKERREFDELKLLLADDDCFIFQLITESGTLAGFCIIWEFSNFVFIEHFAIEPGLRGLRIGEKTLSVIRTQFQKNVILETELPSDEISNRRIRFYERNGFHKLNRTYIQPSYGSNKPEVELKLMSTNVDIPVDELDSIIQLIRKKVYGVEQAQ
ncbi:MAG TPA: GNAT family N-acetyltransferase [Prolixibacteraceae bacterium]|nr:GNAT family N-acetyltransferase [Prolixibacteraceae bacterium]